MAFPRSLVAVLSLFFIVDAAAARELHPVANPGSGPLPGISLKVSVAFGPDGGVAVWRIGSSSVWGAPLDRDGRQTAPARLIVARDVGWADPEVRYLGGSFMLWWQESYPPRAYRARLGADLSPVDVQFLPLAAGAPAAWSAMRSIAFSRSNYDATAHFFDDALRLLRSEPLTGVGGILTASAVVLADGTFVVATVGWDGLFLSRFSADGERIGAPLLIEASRGSSSTSYRPNVAGIATDGESVLVVWSGAGYKTPPELKSLVVDRGWIASPARSLPTDAAWSSISGIAAAWGGGAFTVALLAGTGTGGYETDSVDLFAARFSAAGEPEGAFVRILATPEPERFLTMTTSNGRHLVFLQHGGYGWDRPFVVSVPLTGPVARPDPTAIDGRISVGAAVQEAPAGASDGIGWLAVWVERTAVSAAIRSAPLRPDGIPERPATTLGSTVRYIGVPNVTFDGIDYVVAWHQESGLVTVRVRRDGTPIQTEPLVVAPGFTPKRPAMAGRDGVTLLAWEANYSIRGALVHADGRVSPPFALSLPSREEGGTIFSYEKPVVSAGEKGFLVAWQERRTLTCTGIPCPTSTRTEARLLTREGSPVGNTLAFNEATPAAAASSGGTHLLAFGSGRATVIDAAAQSGPLFDAMEESGTVVSILDGYLLVWRRAEGVRTARLTAGGALLSVRDTDAFALPVAISARGSLLALASISMPGAPYFGVPGVVAQVSETFVPPFSGRRRLVAR